jgi:hypothetical protein
VLTPSANSGCVKIAIAMSVGNERIWDRVRNFTEPRSAVFGQSAAAIFDDYLSLVAGDRKVISASVSDMQALIELQRKAAEQV